MSDKTEQPTPKRLRESREKGDVCKSQDVPSALTVLALSVYIVVMGGQLLESLLAMMELPMKLLSTPYAEAAPRAAEATFHIAVSIVAPLVGLVMAVALVANLGQVGILFAFKGAMPKLENVSPSKWFQKVFSMKNLVEFLKNIIKVTVLGVTVWVVMRDHLPTLFAISGGRSGPCGKSSGWLSKTCCSWRRASSASSPPWTIFFRNGSTPRTI